MTKTITKIALAASVAIVALGGAVHASSNDFEQALSKSGSFIAHSENSSVHVRQGGFDRAERAETPNNRVLRFFQGPRGNTFEGRASNRLITIDPSVFDK